MKFKVGDRVEARWDTNTKGIVIELDRLNDPTIRWDSGNIGTYYAKGIRKLTKLELALS